MASFVISASHDAPLRVILFDSGLGGLSVWQEVAKARPDAEITYLADNAAFPYGALAEDVLTDRVLSLMEQAIKAFHPDCVVLACSTASTLVLEILRERFALPFIGTVPAIKPASERSRTRLISVLATQGTASRRYTQDLIDAHAGDCHVTLVGAPRLALLVEAILEDHTVSDADLLVEIAPCFVQHEDRRTDHIVLACTHYPLILNRLEAIAPWPVTWIDPAPAIATRLVAIKGSAQQRDGKVRFVLTGAAPSALLQERLATYGFGDITHGYAPYRMTS
jgi:glutamate racemase